MTGYENDRILSNLLMKLGGYKIFISILEGPLQGKKFSFSILPLLIGKKNVHLEIPSPQFSDSHFKISKEQDHLKIEDLTHNQGLKVGDQTGNQFDLKSGETIMLVNTPLKIEWRKETQSQVPFSRSSLKKRIEDFLPEGTTESEVEKIFLEKLKHYE